MELKRSAIVSKRAVFRLLIVPYGIETLQVHLRNMLQCTLLIVPYGIETGQNPGSYPLELALLIVPYGIETLFYGQTVIVLGSF